RQETQGRDQDGDQTVSGSCTVAFARTRHACLRSSPPPSPSASPQMTPLTLAAFGIIIIVTSFLSGVFGMAGGLILLGLLLVYFDVPTAMVMLSIVQFAANGWRAVLWWRFVLWRIFAFYVLGAVVAFVLMRLI